MIKILISKRGSTPASFFSYQPQFVPCLNLSSWRMLRWCKQAIIKIAFSACLSGITGLLQIQANPSFCMTWSLVLENSVACRMAQDNVSLSVSRRIARHSFAAGGQFLECPIMRTTLPELAHLEILPAALSLASMATDILPGARYRNAWSTGKNMLLSDWHAIPLEFGIVPPNLDFT